MNANITAAVRGRVRWTILNADGTPDEAATRAAGGGEWAPNLITDAGLAAIAAGTSLVGSTPDSLRYALHVGSGTDEPTAADVALGNRIAATISDGGAGASGSTSVAGGIITNESTVTKIYEATANVNLTEYGFAGSTSSGAAIRIRELFRDGVGDPVTVSLLAGKKVRIDHTLELTLPEAAAVTLVLESFDASDVSEGTVELDATIHPVVGWLGSLPLGLTPTGSGGAASGETAAPSPTGSFGFDGGVWDRDWFTNVGGTSSGAVASYTMRVPETQLNGADITGFFFVSVGATSVTARAGYAVLLTPPDVITKTAEEYVDVTLTITIARAA